jgi:hypothetical protein
MKRGRDTYLLDLNYRFSSLSLAQSPSQAGIVAGDRMPDARHRGAAGQPRRLFDFLNGPHWSLVIGSEPGASPAARRGLQIIEISPNGMVSEEDGVLTTITGLADADKLLIRPDGYVAARVKSTGMDRLDKYLSAILPLIMVR